MQIVSERKKLVDLSRQLEDANSNRQLQQDEIDGLRQAIEGLSAKNSALAESFVAAGEQQANLQVVLECHAAGNVSGAQVQLPNPAPLGCAAGQAVRG